jgi:hypothetical protein
MIIKNRLGKPMLEVERTGDHLEGLALEDANLPEADLRGRIFQEPTSMARAANLRGATLREARPAKRRSEWSRSFPHGSVCFDRGRLEE